LGLENKAPGLSEKQNASIATAIAEVVLTAEFLDEARRRLTGKAGSNSEQGEDGPKLDHIQG